MEEQINKLKEIYKIVFESDPGKQVMQDLEGRTVTAQAGIDPNRKGMDIGQSFGSSSSYAINQSFQMASVQSSENSEEKLDFVFVQTVVAAPVIDEHNGVPTHGRGMATAAAKVISELAVGLLRYKPNALLAEHVV